MPGLEWNGLSDKVGWKGDDRCACISGIKLHLLSHCVLPSWREQGAPKLCRPLSAAPPAASRPSSSHFPLGLASLPFSSFLLSLGQVADMGFLSGAAHLFRAWKQQTQTIWHCELVRATGFPRSGAFSSSRTFVTDVATGLPVAKVVAVFVRGFGSSKRVRRAVSLGEGGRVVCCEADDEQDVTVLGALRPMTVDCLSKQGGDSEMQEFVGALKEAGIPGSKGEDVLTSHPELLLYSVYELRENVLALKTDGWSGYKKVFRSNPMLLAINWVAALKDMEMLGIDKEVFRRWLSYDPQLVLKIRKGNLKQLLELLSELGLSRLESAIVVKRKDWLFNMDNLIQKINLLRQLELKDKDIGRIIKRYPRILGHDLEGHIKRCITILQDLELQGAEIGKVFLNRPDVVLFLCSTKCDEKISFLESFGMNRKEIGRLISKNPAILLYSLERKLKPAMAYLKSQGLTGKELTRAVLLHPRLFGRVTFDCQADKIYALSKFGFMEGSIKLAQAIENTYALSVDELNARLEKLSNLGFSHEDVCRMVTTHPQIMRQNQEEICRRVDYTVENTPYSISDISKIPMFFNYNFDQRIKPRIKMLCWLKSKGLIKKHIALSRVVSMSGQQFMKDFVDCHTKGPARFLTFLTESEVKP